MKTLWMAGTLSVVTLVCTAQPSVAQDKGKTEAAELARESQAALQQLEGTVPLAKALAPKAHAILVFPKVTKAGLGIGGQYGEGTLLKKGAAAAYYKTTGASIGLQAGAQNYGYAMFFMNAKALEQLDNANGFEVGVGPSIVLVDEGMGKSATTTTTKDDIYAFIFGQKGLMAGLGIQGNKIARITPEVAATAAGDERRRSRSVQHATVGRAETIGASRSRLRGRHGCAKIATSAQVQNPLAASRLTPRNPERTFVRVCRRSPSGGLGVRPRPMGCPAHIVRATFLLFSSDARCPGRQCCARRG